MTKCIAHQKLGKQNAQLVGEWVDCVHLKDIPLNQFGRPNIQKILIEILGLNKNARDNKDIKAHFDRLSERLRSPEMKQVVKVQGNSNVDGKVIHDLQNIIKKQEQRITILESTIFALKQKINIDEHAVETGRLIRR